MAKRVIQDETGTTKRFEAAGHPALTYDDYGDSAAAPVVLLHGGAAGSRQSWLDIPRRLAEAFRVLALDMRGHGDSDWADGAYRIEHYAADVEAFIEQVTGAPAALVGASWGGMVAAQVAGTRPELVSKAFFEDAPLQWERYPAGTSPRPFDPDALRERLRNLDDATVAELWAAVHNEAMETGAMYAARQVLLLVQRERGLPHEEIVPLVLAEPLPTGGTIGDLFSEDTAERFATDLLACDPDVLTVRKPLAAYDPRRPMRCPVHLLRADPATGLGGFPPEAEEPFLATHPHATVEFVEGASHGMHFERPEWFAERLLAFLGAD